MFIVNLFSLLGGTLFGVTESINKSVVEHKYSVFAYGFLQNFFNALLYLIPFIFTANFPAIGTGYLLLATIILLYVADNVTIIKAYKTEDISNISILVHINMVVSFIAGVALLSETINFLKIMGLVFIGVGIIVILYEGKRIKPSSGTFFALLSGVLSGIAAYFSRLALQIFPLITFLLLVQVGMSTVAWILPRTRKDTPLIWKKYKGKIILSRITAVIAIFLFNVALKSGAISIVVTNMETLYLLTTVFIGILFLRERNRLPQKITGSLLCVTGIIFLNYFS